MARCHACNVIVQDGYDKKTDRYYCFECFEPTNKVILSNLDAEMESLFGTVSPFIIEDWSSNLPEEVWNITTEETEDGL